MPIAFGATALVALLVALLAWSNTGLLEPITLIMFVAADLGRVAWATRVVGSEVSISAGVVSIVRKGFTHRFDLTNGRPAGVPRAAARAPARSLSSTHEPTQPPSAAFSRNAISTTAAGERRPTPTTLKKLWIWSGNRCSSTLTPASASLRA